MYSPDGGHDYIISKKPKLAFDENKDFATQQKEIRQKLKELLGEMPERVDLNPVIEYQKEEETYTEYRIRFDVEEHVQAVCLLCIPKLGKEKYPLVICLHGHGKGMQVSMGRRYPTDPVDKELGDRDLAVQALEHGYAALSLEQRGMGERRTVKVERKEELEKDNGLPRCHVTAMTALMVGRTLIGERCWDVSRAIDLALTFPEIDGEHIMCTGGSGGGTATYYAACLDERISLVMPTCAVCTFKDSIQAMVHCTCNYVPNISLYMDMGDMAAAIAPRKLIVVHGKDDPIFPNAGVCEAYETIEKIYKAAGVPENCKRVTGDGGHRSYKHLSWPAVKAMKWV